jgi:hypothetical protein
VKDEKPVQPEKAACPLEDFEAGVGSVNSGWLKQVWGKWPGDETIEELLALLDDGNKR